MRTAQFPSRYVQGPGALGRFGREVERLGERAMVLADRNLPASVLDGLNAGEVGTDTYRVEPKCTLDAIARTGQQAHNLGVDMIAGLGGGKVIDLGRAVADELRLPFISVPTVAASDAPCSALAVVYDDNGKVLFDRFVRKNPDLVLVDSTVIAAAPARYFSAGIGDALATYFEADACVRSGADNVCGGKATRLAHTVARLCLDTIVEKGGSAVATCERGVPDADFEDVLEATILLSGIGFESGGVAAAHAFHHGIAELSESHGALHGEKVAFGVLAELALNGEGEDRIAEIARFNLSVNLPTCLADLGITDADAAIPVIAARAAREGEIIHNEPMMVDAEIAANALRQADRLGRSMRGAG